MRTMRLVCWLALSASGLSSPLAAAPRLAGPHKWNAPPIGRQAPYTTSFTFENEGDSPLEIRKITTTSPALTASFTPLVLPPKAVGRLRLQIVGKDLPDEYRHTVLLRTNQPDHAIWVLEIVGEVLGPRTETNEREWYVGSVAPGSRHEHRFTIRNSGAEILTIESIEIHHPSLKAEVSTKKIKPQTEATLKVVWTAPQQEGMFDEKIFVLTDDPQQPRAGFQVRGRISALLGQSNLLQQIPPDAPPVRLRFFYSPGCSVCEGLQRTVIAEVQKRYGSKVRIDYFSLNKNENFEYLLSLKEAYQTSEDAPAYVFVGNRCLAGKDPIESDLEDAVVHFLLHPTKEPDADRPSAPVTVAEPTPATRTQRNFDRFTPWLVAAVGLFDGINPCAFATIVFFISFLTYVGRGRREMLLVGSCFTGAVFLTYLLIGLGALRALKELLHHAGWLSQGVYWAALLLLLILAGYHIYDATIVWATGRTRAMKLQLPDPVKRRIHEVIRTRLTATGLATGALATGFLVTLLESVCTGQTYLPTIVFIMRDPERHARAVLYLVLYNLMFVVPLVGVFLLAYLGTSSKRLAAWGQRNVIPVKIALALAFLAMAYLLSQRLIMGR